MADDVPQWALERAARLTNNMDGSHYSADAVRAQCIRGYSLGEAFARYIAEHEEPPVDPLKVVEDELYENWLSGPGVGARDIIQAALRRGIELARSQDGEVRS